MAKNSSLEKVFASQLNPSKSSYLIVSLLTFLNQMKPSCWSIFNHLLLFLCTLNSLWFVLNTTVSAASGNETDHLALLQFKQSISKDPFGVLYSWDTSNHFCNWHGITCSPMHERVTELNLQGHQLHGSISPYVANLSFLTNLNLMNNSLYGTIPPQLCHLVQLQQLYLNNNSLVGGIPTNLTIFSDLNVLQLSGNKLTGRIPTEIGSLRKLQGLFIGRNNLTGDIPPSVGNLSSLTILHMPVNNLEGNMPQEICHLKNLTTISVSANNLSGKLPFCLYNMSSLSLIFLAVNQFNGSLPPKMFHTLPNLQTLFIGGNQISGPIPNSITNASVLHAFDITQNQFVGQIPSLGKLKDLQLLSFALNNLGGNSTKDLGFLKSLTNCSNLKILDISSNNFGGHLPNSLGNMSHQLHHLYLGGNHISGQIPAALGNINSLFLLTMEDNQIDGMIPTTFGKFKKMQVLDLSGNQLSGNIPANIGNLSLLFDFSLRQNMLDGNIPPGIGNCQKLQSLDLSQNSLVGVIPLEVLSLVSLTNLDLSQNTLSGSIAVEIGRVKNLEMFSVSKNNLTGDIPGTIVSCISLEFLFLQENSFHGIIPSSLASLRGLRHLDLSRNRLSGSIPKDLQSVSFLEYINVSFNMLEGEVPSKGAFRNASKLAIDGNNKLCGGIPELHLSPCPDKGVKPARHHNLRLIAVIVSAVAFLLILLCILTIYWMRKRNKKSSFDPPTIDQLAKVSYQELHQGTDGFSTRNLVGSGTFGSVYKGNLVSEDKVVAVKVMNLQKSGVHKSFIAECNALKNIRHRNLVKILTCCSSTDYKGQEFKALVFYYMKNGSLEQWLHPKIVNAEHPRRLDFAERLNIIIDVASALHYLHHECTQVVLHCDLKPSNVLLDDDMVAHVGDFGIARLVSTIDGTAHKETSSSSTIGIKGTVGYAPPEYGMGSEVSTYGDMYSFAMLVLEILTGRKPTDEMFDDGQNLHMFVERSIHGNLKQILDPHLLARDEEVTIEYGNSGNLIPIVEKCLVSLFGIGLGCSMESPKERMNIVDVMRELNIIRKVFHNGEMN